MAIVAALAGAISYAKTGSGTATTQGTVKLPAPSPSPSPTATPTPTATATAATIATATSLPPLDLSTLALWNWSGVWIASEWNNANSTIPWRYSRISQPAKTDTLMKLDATGAPQLQGGGGMPAYASGLWESEVTLPTLRDGVVVAPLWIYNSTTRDEVDFEVPGRKGLDVTIHSWPNGVHRSQTVRYFAGTDLSGKRLRLGIKVDQAAGTIEMLVNGTRIHRWDRAAMTYFPSSEMKPWFEMWAANPANTGFVQWAGKFTGFRSRESMTLKIHGYGYTPLP